jgi:metal-responsive CopG/Arc/MetJ family transcriptional regulator
MITRRNLWIPDKMWERVTFHAQLQGMKEGRAVSRAEWIREAIRQRVEREEKGEQTRS